MKARHLVINPSPQELRQFVRQMPTARLTAYNNFNVTTKVLARSKACTYVITDTPQHHSDQTISRSEAEEIIKLQDAYMAHQVMIQIDGFIGNSNQHKTPVRLWVEKSHANIAAMQQQLYFTPSAQEFTHFTPEMQVVYTPNLMAPSKYPQRRVIAVDLENNITRILNSDYFGESKKAGLRMWNAMIYGRGGLAMHAGCKVIPTAAGDKTVLIIGLSGTGKTTTTFTRQNGSLPVQDDFVAWMADGSVLSSENGCFAKTYGLDSESEPLIYQAVTSPWAYLENVSQKEDGSLDFFDESYTQNGRATFSFDHIPAIPTPATLAHVDYILILNRNENVIPAVAKLNAEQAAAYFMLGETKGTAAGGAEEAGKALRVPGTNPFFPLLHAQQGTRFLELLTQHPKVQVFLMNTGWVGGAAKEPGSIKVSIRHSSAVVKALAEESIVWQPDATFHYQIAKSVPGLDREQDAMVLNPALHYEKTGRTQEFKQIVQTLKKDRQTHLHRFANLPASLHESVM